ncbi:dentin sialophosphoprotein-like [Diaphorina citri]|uniref:Dentin sialophosphoprotein-like n=1 Tax=Diaphorina citri TaxID=121845 RepID=A0A3Q0J570_DIACI|nr:dentin sialophosphoprotein-like [Diaphorina citri]
MNKLLNMTQMIEEQEEDSQSEVSSSEDSESSSSDSESSESSDETSSSDSETDSKQTDSERNTKLNAQKRKPETDSGNEERNEKKIKVVDEMRGESRKRKSIDDSVEGNEQKRLKTRNDDKEPVIDVEEVEEKNEPSVDMRENNECVSDNNEALDLKQKAEVLPKNETSVEKANEDKPNVQTMKEEPNEIHIGTAETSVKTGVEKEGDTATQKGERTENNKMTVDSERIVVQEETGNKLGDTVGKSSEPNVSAKPSESLIYINSIVNNSDVKPEPSSDANTVPVFNQNIRDSDSKQTFEVKANKYFPVPPKKAKLDSINLLNSINSSCDSIFDSLNKIASTCDSAIRSNETPVDNNVDNDSEVHAIETEVKHTQRVPSDSESCMAYVSVIAHTPSDVAKEKYVIENTMSESKPETSLNKSCESQGNSPTDHTKDTNLSEKTTGVPENTKSVGKSAEVRRISEDDIEIIEDKSPGNKNALETDVMVIDEDSNEEVQVLDPESGMFITVRQKKIKETHGDMENDKATVETANNEAANHDQGTTKDKTNDTRDGTKEVINNEVRTNDTKENTKEDEHKMEEDGISETIKGGTESLDDKETKDNAKNRKELNARSGKDKMDVEDSGSSSGDDSGSSDSETSGSSEEEREQICDDALNLVKKILHDNLTDVKRNTHLSKSDMKKIFLDARYIHQTYSKTWGTRDSVYSKIFVQMTKLLKSVLGGSETVEDSNTSGGGKKKQGEERVKSGADNGGDKTKPAADSVGDKAKPTGDNFSDRMKPVGDNVDRDGKEAGPRNPPLVGNVLPPPPSISAAELMFGSHFLANTMRPQPLPRVNPTPLPRVLPNPPPLPRVIPSPQPLARVPSPQTLGKVTPSPQTLARVHPTPQPLPRMNLTPPVEMSLQQKLAAKQNQTGSAKTIKPLNTAQTHGVVLTNRPGLSVSTEPHGAGPGKLTEPGKILAKPSGTGSAPKTINVTINPTKYMKQKKDALKSASNAKAKETNASTPHLNIKPLQRPPLPSDTQDHTAFKLPKAVSLTKVQPRPESPKPRPLDSTPKVVDLTAPVLPKAISVTKVHVEDRAASPQGQKGPHEASKQVKIKKLQRDGEKNLMSQSGKSKKQLGPKSKTKEAGSFSSSKCKVAANISSKTKDLANTSGSSKIKDTASSTSVLKNFRKPKESKDVSKDKEIIMIELD